MDEKKSNSINKKGFNRENRWDRIRKKHLNNISVTSNTVKKFISMNFIDEKNLRLLRGDGERKFLDPVIVMDMRHELIQRKRKPKEEKDKELEIQHRLQEERFKAHNEAIERTLINNELIKFKRQLELIKPKSLKSSLCIDMSLDKPSEEEEEAMNESESPKQENSFDEDAFANNFFAKLTRVHSEDSPIPPPSPECLPHRQPRVQETRLVRFGEEVEVITYEKEESDEEAASVSSLSSNELYLEIENGHEMDPKGFRDLEITPFDPIDFFEEIQSLANQPEERHYYFTTSDNHIEMTDNFLQIIKYENCKRCEEINFYGPRIFDENRDAAIADVIEIPPTPPEAKKPASDLISIKRARLVQKDYSRLVIRNSLSQEDADKEADRIINELFEERPFSDSSVELLRRAFCRWRHQTTISRITRQNSVSKKECVKKINEFLNKVHLDKNRYFKEAVRKAMAGQRLLDDAVQLRKNYEQKLRLQQEMIDLQKMRLSRQERIITELKLSKLSEEARAAKMEIKEELHNALKRGDVKLRAKAKCIQTAGGIKPEPEEEEKQRLLAQGLIMPKFLARMQARAMERAMKHQEAKDRRLRLEAEKEMAKMAAEEAKRQLDEEAKRRRIDELRDKRRQERIEKMQREKDRQLYLEGMQQAKDFYRRFLMRKGVQGFRAVIQKKREDEIKAHLGYRRLLMRMCFVAWATYTRDLWRERRSKSVRHHRLYLMRFCFRIWKEHFLLQQSKLLVAIDWYEMQICSRIIRGWAERVRQLKEIEASKLRHSEAHYEWQLKWRVLVHWQTLPAINRMERETEMRRQRWRMKIWELLPDYTPVAGEDTD